MRSLVLNGSSCWWRRGTRRSSFLRLRLLFGVRQRARCITLARHGNRVEFGLRRDERVEWMITPPVYLADELVDEVRRLARWRDRVAGWCDRRHGCAVLSERAGTVRLCLGRLGAALCYWIGRNRAPAQTGRS